MFFTTGKPYKILPVSKQQNCPKSNKTTAFSVSSMLTTFLQDVRYVMSRFDACRLATKLI